MKGSKVVHILAVLIILTLLAGCSQAAPPPAPAATQPPAATSAPEPEAEATMPAEPEPPAEEVQAEEELRRLAVAVTAIPTGGGDRYATNELALYKYSLGRLFVVDENGEFQPWLALSWENIEPTIWQFQLRPGVVWDNGDPFTAEDVKYSFDWMLDPDNNHPQRQRIAEVELVEVVDPLTVNLHTDQPSGPLISNISVYFEVLPASYHQEVGEQGFSAAPVGIGPYRIEELVPGESMTLVRNELFWGDPPYFDEIIFLGTTEEATRLAALEAGEVDIIFNVSPENASRIQERGFTTVVAPENRVMTLMVACDRPQGEPLCDTRVRRAMAMSLDTQGISEALYGGLFPAAKGHTANPTMFGFNPNLEPYPYDPEGAMELLAEAGYPNGFSIRLDYAHGRWTKIKELAETVAAQMQTIGINVELVPLDSGTWLADYVSGNSREMTFVTLGPAFDLDFNTVRFTCDNAGVFFCNDEFDEAYYAQKTMANLAEREQALHRLAEVFHEQVAGLPLLEWQAIWAYDPTLANVSINPDASLNIHVIGR